MWSDWSSCMNATCHRPGIQTRTRMYADKRAAMTAQCTETLEQQQQCTLDCDSNQSKNKNKQMMMMSELGSKRSLLSKSYFVHVVLHRYT